LGFRGQKPLFIFILYGFGMIKGVKKFSSFTQKIGELGESIACRYLKQKGFKIVERNYTKRWGEIDIIVQRHNVIHFIEVKSISHETSDIRPEDHVNREKRMRLMRIIQTYIASHKVSCWQFDLVCVYIDEQNKKAVVKTLSDIILEG
jgi:putative endonuclease